MTGSDDNAPDLPSVEMVHYGDTDFSVESQEWHVGTGDTVLVGRLAIDHGPNGAQYMRLASAAENALLDALATPSSEPSVEPGLDVAWKAGIDPCPACKAIHTFHKGRR